LHGPAALFGFKAAACAAKSPMLRIPFSIDKQIKLSLANNARACYNMGMRKNPYKIGRSGGISPRLKEKLKQLPSLKGHEGRWWRRGLIALGVLILVLLGIKFFKPETQLMNSVEIKRIEQKGVLKVGVRDDIPGLCENGVGLEAELGRLLAEKILPNSDEPVSFVVCSSKTVTTKLSDGSIDVAIALQTSSAGKGYAHSYPYYTDTVCLVTLSEENVSKASDEMKIGYIPETPAGEVFEALFSKANAAPKQSIIGKIFHKPAPTPEPGNAHTIDYAKYGSYDELIKALKRGDVDSIVMTGVYINKYFKVRSEDTGVVKYWICDEKIGSVDYCMLSSSESPALMQLADMLIYELREDGRLNELIMEYLADIP
jgi:ABC-type amino acid transport substrate-binding protein